MRNSLKNGYGDPGKVTESLIDRYVAITVREGNRHGLVERFKQAPPGEMTDRKDIRRSRPCAPGRSARPYGGGGQTIFGRIRRENN
jgi:hypothetical protein